ncbi:MATE family efflux transporter [Pseudaestuariivita atlantica]|uniref:Multidrug-efflux transporter n=1 Tax=Pseudaestuariivita atlantica TaxID=1317121 RepID=A0A0L1JUC5_9RHOB|nr:MATE family efflux transporter [Pseudaestuariivita atlantica]KNG94988.1 multidrug transporter MatE [Pseudaestuariivita atlantica]
MQHRMSYPQHARAVLVLGLPLVGGHLAQFAVQLVDTIMLGWYAVEALAAQVLAGSLYFVLFIVGSGFAWAVVPMVASAHAQEDEVQVRRVTRMGLWISVLFGVACLPVFWFSAPVLRALGQEEALARLGQDYLRVMGFAILPHLVIMVMKSYLSALERTQIVLWLSVGGALLNGVLNWILIFGRWGAPELGIAGAGWASLITAIATVAAVTVYAARILPEHALFQRIWRPDPEAFWRVVRLGLPIGGTSLAETGLFAASALMVGWLGTVPLAAHGIALQVASATFMIHLGLANAATIRVGNAHGRNDTPHLARGAVTVLVISGIVATLTIALFVLVPRPILSLFLDPAEPDRLAILALGVGLMAMAGLFQLADGGQVVALGLLRGVQDTRMPMVIAAISYWGIGMPASYLLGFTFGFGAMGVWAGLVVGLMAAAILLLMRFRWMLARL